MHLAMHRAMHLTMHAGVALLLAALLFPGRLRAQARAVVERAHFDTTCAPCADFYQWVNGGWVARTTLDPSTPWAGVGRELQDRNRAVVRAIVESSGDGLPRRLQGSVRKASRFYESCMDSVRPERDRLQPLTARLQRLDTLSTPVGIVRAMAELQLLGTTAPFELVTIADFRRSSHEIVTLLQGGLGLPATRLYLGSDSASVAVRGAYQQHLAALFRHTGDTETMATGRAERVLALETRLAAGSVPAAAQRDPSALYHAMSLDSLSHHVPAIAWREYFAALGVPAPGRLNVMHLSFVEAVGGMLTPAHVPAWRDYLRWRLIEASAPFLDAETVRLGSALSAQLRGTTAQQPRADRCLQQVDLALGQAVGEAYVAQRFSPEARERVQAMVEDLRVVLHERLQQAAWLSPATRAEAVAKLEQLRARLGYPDEFTDYRALAVVDGPFLEQVERARTFALRRDVARGGTAVDHRRWPMSPQTMEAYYSPFGNEMVFPAGVLQPPLFELAADDAFNYGAIGSVIGHELTHGYDDRGRQFDAKGNIRDWWTPDDAARYAQSMRGLVRQYGAYPAVDSLMVDGQRTLGENLADLGGVRLAYLAFQRAQQRKAGARGDVASTSAADGFTADQRFFIAFAAASRAKVTPQLARLQAMSDSHAPAHWRVNGALSNLPEFARAFACPAGSAMVRPDSVRITLW